MGKKIYISYKYADNKVQRLDGKKLWEETAVRDYVDFLQDFIDKSDHINKGEDDGEDMSSLADSTIGSKLGDKIFDSSVTIIFISKGMKENKPEKDQWISWEISYSLKEQSREGGRSKTNAMLVIVLPDETSSYDYYITDNRCNDCTCRTLNTLILFKIFQENMFNLKNPSFKTCKKSKVYLEESSYIKSVKWIDFKDNPNYYIDFAVKIKENINNYEIKKNV